MTVKKGDKIKVDYEGRFESGEVFDSSTHGDHSHPLEFEAGAGTVVKGFDDAVLGMEINQEKEFTIKPEDAYGQPKPELQQKIPLSSMKMDKEPGPGMMIGISSPDGRQAAAKIVAVDKESVTIDINHPLAGKTLIFKIKVVNINTTSTKEENKDEQRE